MIDYMEQERDLSKDILNNKSDRVAICFCVDSSLSMIKNGRDRHVNNGINKFIADCREDDYAKNSVELCIITFGGKGINIVQPFASIKEVSFSGIEPDGDTPLGEAVNKAIDLIEERQELFSDFGTTSYKPWLIIMSDGRATDSIKEASKRILDLLRERVIKVKCIDMSENNESGDLECFTTDKVDTIKGLEIEDFFSMLSRNVARLSTQTPGKDDYEPIQSIGGSE